VRWHNPTSSSHLLSLLFKLSGNPIYANVQFQEELKPKFAEDSFLLTVVPTPLQVANYWRLRAPIIGLRHQLHARHKKNTPKHSLGVFLKL